MSRDLKAEEANFPFALLAGAIPHLRRPFTPEAIGWKVQTVAGTRGMVVPYVNARLVVERLNLVIPAWSDEFERIDGQWVRCRLNVAGIERQDVGTGGDLKSMFSDALKRAAVHFGIGVSLYAMKQTWLESSSKPEKGKLRDTGRKDKKGKPILEIPPDTDTHLREQYATWLTLEGRGAIFGPPLNHGDEAGSMGELSDTEAGDPEQPALDYTDPVETEKQITRIRELWESVDKRKLSKSRLDAMLSGANGDGELDTIEKHVATLAEDGA